MTWIKQHWRGAYRAVAILLLGVGLIVAYWWFYKLAPSRRTLNPAWYSSHSQQDYWCEVQKGISRGMWFHDDGFTVGMYGDKFWAEWIMKHVKPGLDMGCMGSPCHSATSMRFISNQDVGENSDAWLNWWEKNKSKSQEQWIAEGFAQRGIKVTIPPLADQTPALLALLGNLETNATMAIPKEVKYNAFRCLRDSGFEPVGFVLSNQTVSFEIKRGLQEYASRERRWPTAIGVGILPFGKNHDYLRGSPLPVMLTTKFQVAAFTLAFGPLLVGAGLITWSLRKKRTIERTPARDGVLAGHEE
jgi:hypothetical protein